MPEIVSTSRSVQLQDADSRDGARLSAFFVNIHARSDDRRTPIGGRQAHRREARHPTITLRKVSAAMFDPLRDER
jgi:hypothetical protein